MDILHSNQIKTPRISERSSTEELLAAHKEASPQYKKFIEGLLRGQGYDWDQDMPDMGHPQGCSMNPCQHE
jgi:hypothetical protein